MGYHHGMDEEALIQMARDGDLTAFNRLVIAYQNQVYNLALRIMGDPHAADDATQEAFISAYKALRQFRGGSFRSWLLRIVTNACYDELRRRKRHPTLSFEALSPLDDPEQQDASGFLEADAESPEESAAHSELARALEECLKGLPVEFRTVAVLIDVQGHDYKEASQVIDVPLGTIKSRLARARLKMQECLQGYRELLPGKFRLEDERI